MSGTDHVNRLADHLFRREAGRMIAILTRLFGAENLELAEDVVQETLLLACNTWPARGIPDDPPAWLFSVAKNKAIDQLRRNNLIHTLEPGAIPENTEAIFDPDAEIPDRQGVDDDMLRMMFASCHPKIPVKNQLALILKTLCGFSVAEIAEAFMASEETISKRLYRAKEIFRSEKDGLKMPNVGKIQDHIYVVINAIYLIFTEGYYPTLSPAASRNDLIDESMMLCRLLVSNKSTRRPEAYALMALICFHSARRPGRLAAAGQTLLLDKQDRNLWDTSLITEGIEYMNLAACGDELSAYHLEAAIAYEHCSAPDFKATNWPQILIYYNWLCKITPSAQVLLNRIIALLHVEGPDSALEELKKTIVSGDTCLYYAILAEIQTQLQQPTAARHSLEKASALSRSPAEKQILKEKLLALSK